MNQQPKTQSTKRTDNSTLLVFLLCTFIAAVTIAISAMMMTLGTGLASSPEEPVSRVSQTLWGVSGLAFIPCTILLVALIGTQKRSVGIALGLIVIIAGMLTSIGWFIDSGWKMPATGLGDAIVILVVLIPLIAGGLMLRQVRDLRG